MLSECNTFLHFLYNFSKKLWSKFHLFFFPLFFSSCAAGVNFTIDLEHFPTFCWNLSSYSHLFKMSSKHITEVLYNNNCTMWFDIFTPSTRLFLKVKIKSLSRCYWYMWVHSLISKCISSRLNMWYKMNTNAELPKSRVIITACIIFSVET